MNDFYDIAPEAQEPNNSLQLKHLGSTQHMVTISIPKRNDYSKRSYSHHTIKRDTVAGDYDNLFANLIYKTNPPYNVELLLSHHYNKFLETTPDRHKLFLRHIKYVIVPLLEKNKQHKVYVDLVNEWLEEKRESQNILNKVVNGYTDQLKLETASNDQTLKINTIMDNAFISYSWDNEEHEQKVLEFTEHLRKNGYDAKIDKMISQQETATSFVKMMHVAMLNHQKIIVVLSEGYKKKAETFTGGVGEEYQLLLSDISKNPKKYILVSFNGRSDEIIPFGLQGRDIIDLSLSDGLEALYRKLSEKDKYVFSEVSSKKPNLESVQIDDFKTVDLTKVISIESPVVKIDNSSSTGGLYREIGFKVIFGFKNIFGKSIEGFAYEIKIKRELITKSYYETVQDGYYVISESVSSKLFPNATAKTEIIDVRIMAHTINQILGTVVTVSVHTDFGTHTREFQVDDLFKVMPPSQSWGDITSISRDFFL
jgi:hypothetical protein